MRGERVNKSSSLFIDSAVEIMYGDIFLRILRTKQTISVAKFWELANCLMLNFWVFMYLVSYTTFWWYQSPKTEYDINIFW